jgi:hypothetical protein
MDQPATYAPPPPPLRTNPAMLPLSWTRTGKTKTGELIRRISNDLTAHVGGNPSAAQALIIGRSAWLIAHLTALDEAAIKDGGLSPHAATEYANLNNALTGTLSALGLKATIHTTHVDDPTPPDEVAA